MPGINLARVALGKHARVPNSGCVQRKRKAGTASTGPANSDTSPPEALSARSWGRKHGTLTEHGQNRPMCSLQSDLPARAVRPRARRLGAPVPVNATHLEPRRGPEPFGSQAGLTISINRRLLRSEVLGCPRRLRPGLRAHRPQVRLLHSLGWTPLIWGKTRQPGRPTATCVSGEPSPSRTSASQ